MFHTKDKEVVAAGIRGAVSLAPTIHESGIRIIATVIALGRRTVGRTGNERTLNLARGATCIVVVEAVLDFVGDLILGAVIVMGLYDEVRHLARVRGAVGGASGTLEECEGV